MNSLPNYIELKEPTCPICRTIAGQYSIELNKFRIFKCSNCGLEYTFPVPTPTELLNFYSTYADVRASNEIVKLNAQRNLCFLESLGCTQSSRILDFGCGSGEFISSRTSNTFGIELFEDRNKNIYSDLASTPESEFEFVTLWGVLEHLRSPLETIKSLCSHIAPNGHIIITTVNTEGLIPFYYKPPEHLTYWTKKASEILFNESGITLLSYDPYIMLQKREVYLDRLLSRTPSEYVHNLYSAVQALPDVVEIPTNEVLIVGQRVKL